MSDVDSSGDIWFSIKVPVRNSSKNNKDVSVYLQAVDQSDFEVKTVTLQGTIRAGKEEILTDKTYMGNKDFKQIKKWKIVRLRHR
jgi:hypothetical protein